MVPPQLNSRLGFINPGLTLMENPIEMVGLHMFVMENPIDIDIFWGYPIFQWKPPCWSSARMIPLGGKKDREYNVLINICV